MRSLARASPPRQPLLPFQSASPFSFVNRAPTSVVLSSASDCRMLEVHPSDKLLQGLLSHTVLRRAFSFILLSRLYTRPACAACVICHAERDKNRQCVNLTPVASVQTAEYATTEGTATHTSVSMIKESKLHPVGLLCRRMATLEKPHLIHGSQPCGVKVLRHEVLGQEVKLDATRADHELVSGKVDAALVALEVIQAKNALSAALLLEDGH
jgi:hypothetical protein